MLKLLDLLLGLSIALLGLFLAHDKLRASTTLTRVLDGIDSGSVRFASWRANADIRAEIGQIMQVADRAILWLFPVLFLAVRLELRSILIAAGVLAWVALAVSGSLKIAFSHRVFAKEFAKFFGLGLLGVLFLTLGNPENAQGSVLIARSFLHPFGISATTPSEVAVPALAILGVLGLLMYLLMTIVGSGVGFAVFAVLAASRKLGRWAIGVTKPKLIAGMVLLSFFLTVSRALVAYFK